MFIGLQNVPDEIRAFLQEGTALANGGTLSQRRLLQALNLTYNGMVTEMQNAMRPEVFSFKNMTIADPSTGMLSDPVPPDFARAACMSYAAGENPSQGEWNAVYNYRSANNSASFNRYLVGSGGWEMRDNRFFIARPNSNASGGRYRLWYFRSVPPLSYAPTVANGTSDTIALNPNPTFGAFDPRLSTRDIWRGAMLFIYAGPGAGQYVRIVSVDENWVATVESVDVIGGTPFATPPEYDPLDADATSHYALQPIFAVDHYPLWIYRTGMSKTRIFGAVNFDADAVARAEVAWREYLRPIDRFSPTPINKVAQSDLGVGNPSWGGGSRWWR